MLEQKRKKKVLSISSLCFSSMHCSLFAMWVSSFQKPKALVAEERKMHVLAVASVVRDDRSTRTVRASFCLFGRLGIFFYCNCRSAITSHLVNS